MIPNSSDKIFEHSVRFGNDDDVHYKSKFKSFLLSYNVYLIQITKSWLNSVWYFKIIIFLTVATLDCLKVDFSNQDFDHLRPSQNEEFLLDVSSIKPEVILTDHIQESQFLMQTNATLRMLGYTGHLGCLQNGRGLGVFVRKDIADRLTLVPKTIFQWENISEKLLITNPCDRNGDILISCSSFANKIRHCWEISYCIQNYWAPVLYPSVKSCWLVPTVRLWVAFRSGLSLLCRYVLHLPFMDFVVKYSFVDFLYITTMKRKKTFSMWRELNIT